MNTRDQGKVWEDRANDPAKDAGYGSAWANDREANKLDAQDRACCQVGAWEPEALHAVLGCFGE